MINYSHSKLEILRKCFLNYKYKYVDKLDDEQDRSAADFGEVCHIISEKYNGTGKKELLSLYKEITKQKYVLNEFYIKKIPLALKNIHTFYTNYLNDPNVVDIKRESDILINLNETIQLNGKIDLIITYKNNRVKIIDYKTSKAKNANHTNQLSMYKLLIHKKYNIPYDLMDTEIIYLALNAETKYGEKVLNEGIENIKLPYSITETDIFCLISEIEQIDNMIKLSTEKNDWKSNPTWFNCTYCGYNKICPKKFVKG